MSNSLASMLRSTPITRFVGAHNPLGARLIEQAGFDAVWASGLEISAAQCVPDSNILSVTQVLDTAGAMARQVRIPVLADCDSGFGNVNNVVQLVKDAERAGISGICIEDKLFPKLNSFAGGDQTLETTASFAAKIYAATRARTSHDFVVCARIEALISGAGMENALDRAAAYEAAGADALLIHSKSKSPSEILEFRSKYMGRLPVIVVPTTYHSVSGTELQLAGFSGAIYANQVMRASITAVRALLERLRAGDGTTTFEDEIASVKEIFDLQRLDEMLDQQERAEAAGRSITGGRVRELVES